MSDTRRASAAAGVPTPTVGSVQTNGLIFLVIVAIWAVYLLQHWVRRRENLATARSVDRFSDAMRVLERRQYTSYRRDPAPVQEMSDGRSERPTTPTASVKPSRPSLRAGAAMSQSDSHDDESAKSFAGFGREGDPAARVRRTTRQSEASGRQVSVGNRFFKAAAAVTPAKVRAWALVTAVVLFVLTVVLTPLGFTPWWSPLLALAALAGVVAWLRSRVVRSAHAASTARPQAPARRVERAPAAPAARTAAAAPEVPVYDVDASTTEATEADVEQETPAESPAPGTWAPVAVPPPTYTLKARADRPEPEPAATVEPAEAPSPAAKYADTPVEDLPFDGLALDEDLEDLPEVHRAG